MLSKGYSNTKPLRFWRGLDRRGQNYWPCPQRTKILH